MFKIFFIKKIKTISVYERVILCKAVQIQISLYSGDINWQAVKSSAVQVCYMKATEGSTYTNKKYAEYGAGQK
ncbi:hypothetical protein DN407_31310 (plasmid) [Bacillus sp. JAS24-2]|nr:hypothetical protein DN407_31310 [Bacillus sp. JAS24-2]